MNKKILSVILGIIVIIIGLMLVFGKSKQINTPVTNPYMSGGNSANLETTNPNGQNEPLATTSATSGNTNYTLSEVSIHNNQASCWTAINGGVYDLTTWISEHPGGEKAILSLCGKDGSTAFNNQHGGQTRPEAMLASFKIGTLVK